MIRLLAHGASSPPRASTIPHLGLDPWSLHAPEPLSTASLACLVSLALATSALRQADPLSPTPDGRREVREETNVAPFLAAWKAAAFKHARLAAAEVTANQQQYDVTWYDLNADVHARDLHRLGHGAP